MFEYKAAQTITYSSRWTAEWMVRPVGDRGGGLRAWRRGQTETHEANFRVSAAMSKFVRFARQWDCPVAVYSSGVTAMSRRRSQDWLFHNEHSRENCRQ